MPCRYVIDKGRRLVISIAWGNVTFAEMKAHQDQLRNDPDFDAEFNQLIDGTNISRTEITRDELRAAADKSPFSANSRRAFVSGSPFVFGMERMFMTYIEMSRMPSLLAIFRDLASASKWLGLKDPQTIEQEGRMPAEPAEASDQEKTG